MADKFNVGDIVIDLDKEVMVEVEDGEPMYDGCFCGTSIVAIIGAKVGDTDDCWDINRFEIATKENTPEEWWEYLSNNDKFVENVEEIAERYDIQVIKKENETPKKYRVVKLNPTENQERQYGVMLLKNLTEIIEGQTMAFINSKGSGGVIYGRKANGLLNKLVISNPNKHITVVKTLKAHGKKQEAIKQISIKIENRIEPSEFVL